MALEVNDVYQLNLSICQEKNSFPGLVSNCPEESLLFLKHITPKGPLEEGMATHSSILAWRIQWTEEPGGLQSIGSHRVRHN